MKGKRLRDAEENTFQWRAFMKSVLPFDRIPSELHYSYISVHVPLAEIYIVIIVI